jgi:hypothetical protein
VEAGKSKGANKMGSGPVIITDDGGPPLTNREPVAGAWKIRVWRTKETMDELKGNMGAHPVSNAHGILCVLVKKNGELSQLALAPASVSVNGDTEGVGVQSDGKTATVMTPGPGLKYASVNGFDVYESQNDKIIRSVQIDSAKITTDGGSQTRVEIYFF